MFGYNAVRHIIILNYLVSFGPIWVKLVSLSSEFNGHCWGIVTKHLACTGLLASYSWHWISYVRLVTHIINLHSFVSFGPIWVKLVSLSSEFNGHCWGIVTKHLACTGLLASYSWHWISYVRLVTHIINLHSFVSFGPKRVKLVSLSSECNAHRWGTVIKHLACTGHLALYSCHWISYVRVQHSQTHHNSQQLCQFWSKMGQISVIGFRM